MSNVVADVRKLATAAKSTSHPLSGVVQTPAKWAEAAGYPGSKASNLRKHMARDSGNGVGRTGRYPAVDAAGMVGLLDEADKFHAAESDAKKQASAKRIADRFAKARGASARGAKQAKTAAKATPRKAKATK